MKGVSFYWLTLQTWYPIKTRAQCEQNILLFQITILTSILTSRDVATFSPVYFSVKFSMFCIEQAKIYTKPKFGSDRAFGG